MLYPKYLNMIETILNMGARLAIGDFKSSLIESIRSIVHELPSELRRLKLNLLHAARTKRNKDNPANKYMDNCTKEAEK